MEACRVEVHLVLGEKPTKGTLAPQTRADILARVAKRLGNLPEAPDPGFIGRSRELLTLQRLFDREGYAVLRGQGAEGWRYAVLRGQGAEGKTALAAEFGRWMVRPGQVYRDSRSIRSGGVARRGALPVDHR